MGMACVRVVVLAVFMFIIAGFTNEECFGMEVCMPSAVKEPMDEVIAEFRVLYGLKPGDINAIYEPPDIHQARINTGEVGDVFVFACDDPELFKMTPSRIKEETRKEVALKALSIGLPEGNSMGIQGLEDILRLPVIIGAVSTERGDDQGMATAKMIDELGIEDKLYNRLKLVPTGKELLPMLLKDEVQALFCWDITEAFNPGKLDIVKTFGDRYTKPVFIAVTRQSKQPDLSLAFVEYSVSEQSRQRFQEHGFPLP
jgi:ABC-type molybdate transport system substrate-binding protein